jgi:hypothetical protein
LHHSSVGLPPIHTYVVPDHNAAHIALIYRAGGVAAGYASAGDAKGDAPDIAEAFFDGIYGSTPVDEDTNGFQTLDQPFAGQFFESNWGALDDADMVVSQNSWFTTDPDTGAVAGVAWGYLRDHEGRR